MAVEIPPRNADPRGGDQSPGTSRSGVLYAVRQLLRLWGLFARMDLLWLSRSTRDALMWLVSDLVARLAGIMTTLLLAERFHGIGHWSKAQIIFMLGYAMVVGGVLDTLFGYNVKMISRRIGRGQLDHMLVQPQPLWRLILTEGFMPYSQPIVLVVAGALLAWSSTQLAVVVTPLWLLLLAGNLLASAVIVLSVQLGWGSLAFWAPRSAEEITMSTDAMVGSLGTLPLDNVPRVLLGGLLTAMPVGFVAWVPARAITGVAPLFPGALVTLVAAPVFFAVAVLVFRKGLRHYGRVGSKRYSPFGHRR
ncbi:ABC-2 family transporter protein [Actinopolymorpha sp. B11F2]|uniref:ABC-2 family transporter protein n=1 Tax=Actinopolymorpha sp. B11F2 TaxID=3160862 RepID=UPI0032E4E7B5